ncbi:MAG: sulfatase-like hydrolase/transferase, partial [Phycisphaeraceae bacterium]|nr:sulfatase-like hydrolase/transferase [Phycisphaeraceae bacterium]
QNIGRILATLGELKVLDNTLIVFLADNGASAEYVNHKGVQGDVTGTWGTVNSFECISRGWAHAANTPMRLYKATSHEGGINTPMIIHWPRGITCPGTVNRAACHLIDFLPTWMDLTDATYPGESTQEAIPPLDGISLRPTFSGQGLTRDNPLFFQFGQGRAVHEGPWKLVRRGRTPWELYDLSKDRTETQDLAIMLPQRVNRMTVAWDDWFQTSTGKPFPTETKTKRAKRTKK